MLIDTAISLISKSIPEWNPKIITDIGSNVGQQTVELAGAFPGATIIACEPDPEVAKQCVKAIAGLKNVIFRECAVSETDGDITFYRSLSPGNNGYGSIYQPSGKYDCIEAMPVEPIKVKSRRLDSLLTELKFDHVDFMWSDAQGADLNVIKSLGGMIAMLSAVWLEYMIGEMYTGQPMADDIDSYLSKAGMTMIHKVIYWEGWWGDACYARIPKV